jgi:hypothetical protein
MKCKMKHLCAFLPTERQIFEIGISNLSLRREAPLSEPLPEPLLRL